MSLAEVMFYLISTVTVVSALAMIIFPHPVQSALSLVLSMIGLAGLFYGLEAYFVAAAQLVVYAGAVMVLFVMILMLTSKSIVTGQSFSLLKGLRVSHLKKISLVGLFLGILLSAVLSLKDVKVQDQEWMEGGSLNATKELSLILFKDYIFAFETISLVLLMVIVGVIALAKNSASLPQKEER